MAYFYFKNKYHGLASSGIYEQIGSMTRLMGQARHGR